MKIFWKIYLAVLVSFIIVVFSTSYIISAKQIADRENCILNEKTIIGNLVSNEVASGYLESKWPFESLKELAGQDNFLFWWVVKKNGEIYLADDSYFIGTYARDYFPDNKINESDTFINEKQNYGIFHNSFEAGKEKWTFWLGFSLKEVSEAKNRIIITTLISSFLALLIMGIILYFVILRFTKPIEDLTKISEKIKEGNLDCEIKASTKDEIGKLAKTFDEMRLGLKDRSDLLNSLLATFKGKFGNLATILVRKDIQDLVKKNPRIAKILPKSLGIILEKGKKFQRESRRKS